MSNSKIAIYPGTFDPITFGHVDIINKSLKICDQLIIGVAKDNAKNPLFSLTERKNLILSELINHPLDRIKVVTFEGLLVDFAKKQNASLIIRGLRAVSDFEYEFQMCGMNAKLNNNIQTIFIPASESTQFIASRLVKEVSRLNGDVTNFVSANIAQKLKDKF